MSIKPVDINNLDLDGLGLDSDSAVSSAAPTAEITDFDWIMESAVYSVKNSLALLHCLLEQQGLQQGLGLDEEHHNEQVNIIQRETSRIDNDTTQLLALYRMHKKQLTLRVDEVDVHAFLDEALVAHDLLLKSRGLELLMDCDDDVVGFFDPALVRSILHSAIVAGVKYASSTLRIYGRYEDDAVVIGLEDDGSGYPEQLRNRYGGGEIESEIEVESCENRDGDRGATVPEDDETERTHLNFFFAASVASLHRNAGQRGYITLENLPAGGGRFEIYLP